MVKVKICGNQSVEDVQITSDADAQGFIVLADSPRGVELEPAADLMQYVPLFNTTVLVTTVTDPLLISDLVEALEPNAIQIHVELSSLQLQRIRRALSVDLPLYSVLHVDDDDPEGCLERAERIAEGPVDALLLDSRMGDKIGGTGVPHNWETSARIRAALDPLPVILAGGITPDNVLEAIDTVRPYAVDVASGVETSGEKDEKKVQALLKKVRTYGI